MFDSIASYYVDELQWDIKTLYLYYFIVIITWVFGVFSQYTKPLIVTHNYTINKSNIKSDYYYLIFIVLLLFSGLRCVGTDYSTYKEIFDLSVTSHSEDFLIEPGWVFLNKILKIFGLNFETVIFIFSFVTIYCVFSSIRRYAGEIYVSLALLSYATLYYLPGFNMIRMYMAASFTLCSYRYLLSGHTKKFFVFLALICFIHYSALLFFIPAIGVVLYKKHKKLFWVSFFIGWFLAFKIVLPAFPELNLIARYESYMAEDATENSVGFLQWIINIPIIFLCIYAYKKIPDSPYLPFLIVLTVCHLFIGILDYKIVMIGRSLVYYNALFIIIIPLIIKQLSEMRLRWSKFIQWTYVVYLFGRFYLYLTGYLFKDGIMPYKSIFDF